MSKGLHHDTKTLGLVLRTTYFGVRDDDNSTENIAKSSTLEAKPHILPYILKPTAIMRRTVSTLAGSPPHTAAIPQGHAGEEVPTN